uniref:Stage 0 sporulation protein A homolog n=1 Tax=Eubacterium plexicaudatum ASF492 TaxID=1235802 RepID=N2ATX9_9FIRM
MRYKVLLVGNNKATIEDMFLHANSILECQSTSIRFDDIVCHLKYFQPHVLVYCMHNETRDTMSQLITIKHTKLERKTPFFLVATQEDCDEMRKMSAEFADVSLIKPITALQIAEKITEYMKRNFSIQEEEAPTAAPLISAEQQKTQELLDDIESMFEDAPITSRKHILVVDDDFRMLKLIKRYLDDTYDIATAINGKVALKFLETKMTNLILLDYEMPEENGPAVLEKLRANPVTSSIPVIFLTGINDRKKIQQVLMLKPQGYLLKPIDHDKLVETIEKTIG